MKSRPKQTDSPADDYQALALETIDSLLAGPLSGGLGPTELHRQFPVIRAALRQIRSDLNLAADWPAEDFQP